MSGLVWSSGHNIEKQLCSLLAQSGHAEKRNWCRYWGQSGHTVLRCICLLLTQSGHHSKLALSRPKSKQARQSYAHHRGGI